MNIRYPIDMAVRFVSGPGQLIICPYDAHHIIRAERLAMHLWRCSRHFTATEAGIKKARSLSRLTADQHGWWEGFMTSLQEEHCPPADVRNPLSCFLEYIMPVEEEEDEEREARKKALDSLIQRENRKAEMLTNEQKSRLLSLWKRGLMTTNRRHPYISALAEEAAEAGLSWQQTAGLRETVFELTSDANQRKRRLQETQNELTISEEETAKLRAELKNIGLKLEQREKENWKKKCSSLEMEREIFKVIATGNRKHSPEDDNTRTRAVTTNGGAATRQTIPEEQVV
ncbi:Hypp6130 [Branchiostoma lanceolatum]|uniref:Hypp6130 protein n=1 Tax=Branchiostoma lanceolatum TaxID=7740 RepID=A0A8J9VI76_BRALA|nr:Hypp6130 [Branchiostoma lanceolatum]